MRCLNDNTLRIWGSVAPAASLTTDSNLEVAVNRFGPVVVALNEDGVPVTFRGSQSQQVSNVTNAIDVDSGLGHMCAMQNDGLVKCWGSNY